MLGENDDAQDFSQQDGIFTLLSPRFPASLLPIPEIHEDLFVNNRSSAFEAFLSEEGLDEDIYDGEMDNLSCLLDKVNIAHLEWKLAEKGKASHKFSLPTPPLAALKAHAPSSQLPTLDPVRTTTENQSDFPTMDTNQNNILLTPQSNASTHSPQGGIVKMPLARKGILKPPLHPPANDVMLHKDHKQLASSDAQDINSLSMDISEKRVSLRNLDEVQVVLVLSNPDLITASILDELLNDAKGAPAHIFFMLLKLIKTLPVPEVLKCLLNLGEEIPDVFLSQSWGLSAAKELRARMVHILGKIDIPEALALSTIVCKAVQRPNLQNGIIDELLVILVHLSISYSEVYSHIVDLLANGLDSESTKVAFKHASHPMGRLLADLSFLCVALLMEKSFAEVMEVADKRKKIVDCYGAFKPFCPDLPNPECLSVISSLVERLTFASIGILAAIPAKVIYLYLIKTSLRKEVRVEDRTKCLDLAAAIAGKLRHLPQLDPKSVIDGGSWGLLEDLVDIHKLTNHVASLFSRENKDAPEPISSLPIQHVQEWVREKSNGVHPDKFSALLLQLCSDSSPIIRAKAAKEFIPIIEDSDYISRNENFVNSIIKMSSDPSPSVRDAALEVLSLYLKDSTYGPIMFTLFTGKLEDSSVAVRKRCVKTLSEFMSDCSAEDATKVRVALIHQAGGNYKSSSTLAFDVMTEKWMTPIEKRRAFLIANGDAANERQLMAQFTAEVIRIIRDSDLDKKSFKTFMAKISISPQGEAKFENLFKEMVDLLLETLVSSLENGSDAAVKFILAALVTVLSDRSNGLGQHFRLFCALLCSEDSETVENCLELIKLAVREDMNLYRQVPDIVQSLFRLAFRGSEQIVKYSLEVLFLFSQGSHNVSSQLRSMQDKLLAFIRNRSRDFTEELIPAMSRAIYSLGVLYRLFVESKIENEKTNLSETTSALQATLQLQNATSDLFTFMGAAEIFVADPLLSLQEPIFSIIKTGLCHENPVSRLVLIQGFHECLAKDLEINQVSTFADGSQAKMDYSSSLCTVFQAYIGNLVEVGHCYNPEVVLSTALLLGTILRKGLCHPQLVVSAIISLNNTPWASINGRIGEICQEVLNQHEIYCLTSIPKICSLNYSAQKAWRPHSAAPSGVVLDDEELPSSMLQFIFDSLSAKTKRSEFLLSLLRELNFTSSSDVNYLIYIAEVLVEIKFKLLEEVSLVIGRVSEMLMLHEANNIATDAEDDKSMICWEIIILQIRQALSGSYRMNVSDLEKLGSKASCNPGGRKEQLCKRLSHPELSLHALPGINIETLRSLRSDILSNQKIEADLEANTIETTRKRSNSNSKNGRPRRKRKTERDLAMAECPSNIEDPLSNGCLNS